MDDWQWAYRMLRWFERQRAEHGDNPCPGYWSDCILNYAEYLDMVWC
ncbi:hypothetical protein [Bradyrhizobium sp. HKCCYLS20291]